jgi:pimeloyl-ACP methyl ester carboxylesterase
VDWLSPDSIRLQDEVDFLAPVFREAGERFVLVGHSYGAAIALRAALQMPERVVALALHEPTLFSLIEAEGPAPNDADGIRDTVLASGASLDAGDPEGAAECFIDYWMGAGSWASTAPERKPAIVASVRNIRRWAHALMTEPAGAEELRVLRMPVLCLTGSRTTRSALGVTERLLRILPDATHVELQGVGHMAPVTHPDVVNSALETFLDNLRIERAPAAGALSAGSQRPTPA